MIAAEDERAIRELYARAIHLFDASDKAWVDCWTDTPEFVFPADVAAGRPELRLDTHEALSGMVDQAFAMMGGRGMHHFTDFVFDAVEGGIRVRAYLLLVINGATMADPATIMQNTRIDDLVVQQGGRWLFERRSIGATW